MRIALLLVLVLAFAIDLFAVKFGLDDARRWVRIPAVLSGLSGMLCAICVPGAALRYMLSGDSTHLVEFFAAGSVLFTALALLFSIAIAVELRGSAA